MRTGDITGGMLGEGPRAGRPCHHHVAALPDGCRRLRCGPKIVDIDNEGDAGISQSRQGTMRRGQQPDARVIARRVSARVRVIIGWRGLDFRPTDQMANGSGAPIQQRRNRLELVEHPQHVVDGDERGRPKKSWLCHLSE